MPEYITYTHVRITSGKHDGRTGRIEQPPIGTWPNGLGCVGILLDRTTKKEQVSKLFGPSQFEIV